MIIIQNVKTVSGETITHEVDSQEDRILDVEGRLTMLPALIDPHVHFRTPGHPNKEDWISGAAAAIAGGYTTVFDMPNTTPSVVTAERLHEKKRIIEAQLYEAHIPLRFYLYFGASKDHLDEISKVHSEVIGIKVFMGSSTGDLLVDDPTALDRVFQIAGQHNLIVAVHAEDETTLKKHKAAYRGPMTPNAHSKIRDREAAIVAVEKAIHLAEKYDVQLYICHVTTREELSLIRDAKANNLLIYAEATPHHLFLTEEDYATWGCKVQMNPPLRTKEDQQALWAALMDGTIDTLGTDHAPHTLDEKERPYGEAPSGVPGLETALPLMLDACNRGKIPLETIVELTHLNPTRIFRLPIIHDIVLVDMEREKEVRNEYLKTKCGWSPFAGRTLKGWPAHTILKGKIYDVHY